jgi:superfamily II DNA or RNA helicase
MEKQKIYGDTLENWQRIAKGKKTIIYCASIKSSIETVKRFKEAGYKAEHLDGETPKAIRQEIMKKFRSGEITVLSNNELFGEGLDVPDCECVILLRPTKSLSLFIQQSMRSMRIDPKNSKKEAIIIDHVKNIYEHGFPDEEREWSLKAKKAKKKCEVPIKQCVKCFHVMNSLKRKCDFCGYEVVNEQRYEVEKVDMELKQLKRQDTLQKQHHDYYKNLQTFSQLAEFQKTKGYKFGWTLRKAEELGIEIPSKYKYMLNKFIKKSF